MGENKWRKWSGGSKYSAWPFGIKLGRGICFIWHPKRATKSEKAKYGYHRRWRKTRGFQWPV